LIKSLAINRTGSRGRSYDIENTIEVIYHPETLA
jgi:hypothetical protein